MTKPRNYILWQALITLILGTLIVGILEYATRIRYYRKFGPKSLAPLALRDEYRGWRLNPAYARIGRQHDAQGFRRDRDVSLKKPPNTIRIFMTGGSVTYGFGGDQDDRGQFVSDNQTIEYYLERQLNQALPFKHWEVINAGVSGYRLNQELIYLESDLLQYQPDYVISMDGFTDIDYMWEYWSQPKGTYNPYAITPLSEEFNLLANPASAKSIVFFANTWCRTNSALYRVMTDHLAPLGWESAAQATKLSAATRHTGNTVRLSDLTQAEQSRFTAIRDQVEYYPHLVQQMHRILNLDGVKDIFLLQPYVGLTHKQLTDSERQMVEMQRRTPGRLYTFQQIYPNLATEMGSLARQEGFEFKDLTGVFDQSSEQTFGDYAHLTPEGNRIIAERLFQLLKDKVPDSLSAAAMVPGDPRR